MTTKKALISLVIAGMMIFLCLAPAMASTGKININTATKEELVTLKYIGDKIAQKIIEYRKTTPFVKAEDITNVKGVGSKVFEANKMRIIVQNE